MKSSSTSEPDVIQEDSPLFFGDPFQVCVDPETATARTIACTSSTDPAWVATIDPKLIESLRDVVNFVD
ncbi:uncharacterized protein B0I36DRAFT_328638 [Microdochium trichocladiopsis]|uniref:Uncharacterized protein n=1 Tax=Microdochium trichocladiopsis TaxID=1682393 RepID=A0A9P8Y3D6_9PEZI|nr:uncharacterized protein B0I36DRAFT_328638 [Microdochium trichocladiopsis]KAH7028114.1 hypothetical protein B0I36DRAFT_328638 [Microdochium trichocladiopsis]